MKTLFRVFAALVLTACSLSAAPSFDPRNNLLIGGTDNQVKSGAVFTFKTGSSLILESGVTLSGVQTTDAEITALAGLTSAADKLPYWTGSGTAANADFPSVSRTLLGYTTANAWRNAIFPSSATEGATPMFDGTNWINIAIGTTGQVPVAQADGTWLWDDLTVSAAAADVTYDPTTSGLTATNVQEAIDELETMIGGGGGSGDVVGPSSATDNAIARFDSTTGKLIQDSTTTLSDAGLFGFADGVRQIFNPDATNAGFNVGSLSGDPSSPSNGDVWYDSASNELTARINGSNVALGSGGGGGYTDEQAQDAVGTILTDSDTIDFTYTDATPAITAAARVQMSITSDASGLKLSGDSGTPGNTKYYGTDSGGTKGWYSITGGGDVVGPSSSNNSRIVLMDGGTGKLIKQSPSIALSSATFIGTDSNDMTFQSGGGVTIQTQGSGQTLHLQAGGGGIVYVNSGDFSVAGSTPSTNKSTGSTVTNGGLGVNGHIFRAIGSSTISGNVPAIIYNSITATGNVGTGEDTLISQSIAANVLPTNGNRLRVRATFTFAANGNNKTLKAKFGGTTFYDSTALGINGGSAVIEAIITRTGGGTQNISMTINSSNATLPNSANVTTAAETLSGAITLSFTGEATSDDDISQKELLIEYLPSP